MAANPILGVDLIIIKVKQHFGHVSYLTHEADFGYVISSVSVDCFPHWYLIIENLKGSNKCGRESVKMVPMVDPPVSSSCCSKVFVNVVPSDCRVSDNVSKGYLVSVSVVLDVVLTKAMVVHGAVAF